RLRPAGIAERALMLRADHQERIAGRRQLDVVDRLQRLGKAAREALRLARFLVDHTLQAESGEHGHRRLARLDAPLCRQRIPARAFFALGKAIGVFAGVAERRAVDLLRAPAADVADDELQRPADGAVGTVALPQHIALGVHADAAADRSVHHD